MRTQAAGMYGLERMFAVGSAPGCWRCSVVLGGGWWSFFFFFSFQRTGMRCWYELQEVVVLAVIPGFPGQAFSSLPSNRATHVLSYKVQAAERRWRASCR
ncbi:hypothetical protein PMIN06_010485 [Paraphaeosphaeria minitans]